MRVPPPDPTSMDDDLVADVRLRAALDHAPDSAQRPPAALRSAVLQAARASLPQKPTLWQRLFGSGPATPPRWLTAAAGVGAFGLALNLAWHMASAPPPDEYGPVASVHEVPAAAAPGVLQERAPSAADVPAETTQGRLSAPPPEPAPKALRDMAPPAPMQRPAAEPAPTIVAQTSPPPAPAAPAAPPAPQRAAETESKKMLAREEPSNADRVAEVAATNSMADKAVADERRRSAAAGAAAPITPTTSAAPADSARQEGLAAAAKPAAPAPEAFARAKQPTPASPAEVAAPVAAAPAAPPAPAPLAAWPQPLARFGTALAAAESWPAGWQIQGPAEMAIPRRAWWQALLAGTSGRWQGASLPWPSSVDAGPTWRLHGPDGTSFSITLADGQAWLQSGGGAWRAPWSALPDGMR